MAHEEQQKILKKGAAFWNEWRKEHADAAVDLESADLSGMNLDQGNFSDALLSRANLSYASLREAVLASSDFRHVNLFEADLTGANLSSINLASANVFLVKCDPNILLGYLMLGGLISIFSGKLSRRSA